MEGIQERKTLNYNIKTKRESKFVFLSIRQTFEILFYGLSGFLFGNLSVFGISPLGLSFAASALGKKRCFYSAVIFSALGYWTSGNAAVSKYITALALLMFSELIFSGKEKNKAAFMMGITAFSGAAYAMLNSFSLYFMSIGVIEAILVFGATRVFEKGEAFFEAEDYTANAQLGAVFILSVIISGAAWFMPDKAEAAFTAFTCLFIITSASFLFGGGTGSGAGCIIGTVLFLINGFSPDIIVMLGLAGLLCGSVREYGRIACALGFIGVSAIFGFYMKLGLFSAETGIGAGVSAAAFILFSKKLPYFTKTVSAGECFVNGFEDFGIKKLASCGEAFLSLGKRLEEQIKRNKEKEDMEGLVDYTAKKICGGCGLSVYCWDKNFNNTYNEFCRALKVCHDYGRLTEDRVPETILKDCVKLSAFIREINQGYEIYRQSLIWQDRLSESKELMSEELLALGEALKKMAAETKRRNNVSLRAEKAVSLQLKEIGADKVNVFIEKDSDHGYGGAISFYSETSENFKEAAESLLSDALGREMKLRREKSVGSKSFKFKVQEKNKYRVLAYVSGEAKEKGVSGDSHSFFRSAAGEYILMISDGMGSGEKARQISCEAIELLEQFTLCGFPRELAVRLINGFLIQGFDDGVFATLDICAIDLFTGRAEFMKTGAAPSYVLKKDKTKVIRTSSLPAGIMKNMDVDKKTLSLLPGDIVIMVSDGIIDAGGGEEWLISEMEKIKSRNPKEISETILLKAKEKAKNGAKDDMTVLTARFWKTK